MSSVSHGALDYILLGFVHLDTSSSPKQSLNVLPHSYLPSVPNTPGTSKGLAAGSACKDRGENMGDFIVLCIICDWVAFLFYSWMQFHFFIILLYF